MNAIDHSAMCDAVRLLEFEETRVRELVASGVSQIGAARFAKGEAEARASAALTYGIEQALSARLVVLTKPGREEPLFCLIYEPIA